MFLLLGPVLGRGDWPNPQTEVDGRPQNKERKDILSGMGKRFQASSREESGLYQETEEIEYRKETHLVQKERVGTSPKHFGGMGEKLILSKGQTFRKEEEGEGIPRRGGLLEKGVERHVCSIKGEKRPGCRGRKERNIHNAGKGSGGGGGKAGYRHAGLCKKRGLVDGRQEKMQKTKAKQAIIPEEKKEESGHGEEQKSGWGSRQSSQGGEREHDQPGVKRRGGRCVFLCHEKKAHPAAGNIKNRDGTAGREGGKSSNCH